MTRDGCFYSQEYCKIRVAVWPTQNCVNQHMLPIAESSRVYGQRERLQIETVVGRLAENVRR